MHFDPAGNHCFPYLTLNVARHVMALSPRWNRSVISGARIQSDCGFPIGTRWRAARTSRTPKRGRRTSRQVIDACDDGAASRRAAGLTPVYPETTRTRASGGYGVGVLVRVRVWAEGGYPGAVNFVAGPLALVALSPRARAGAGAEAADRVTPPHRGRGALRSCPGHPATGSTAVTATAAQKQPIRRGPAYGREPRRPVLARDRPFFASRVSRARKARTHAELARTQSSHARSPSAAGVACTAVVTSAGRRRSSARRHCRRPRYCRRRCSFVVRFAENGGGRRERHLERVLRPDTAQDQRPGRRRPGHKVT